MGRPQGLCVQQRADPRELLREDRPGQLRRLGQEVRRGGRRSRQEDEAGSFGELKHFCTCFCVLSYTRSQESLNMFTSYVDTLPFIYVLRNFSIVVRLYCWYLRVRLKRK